MIPLFLFATILLGFAYQRLHPIMKLKSSRYTNGQHLYFASAFWGAALIAVAGLELVIISLTSFEPLYQIFQDLSHLFAKIKASEKAVLLFGLFSLAGLSGLLLIGLSLARCQLNKGYTQSSLERVSSSLELFFDFSLKNVQLVRIVMDNDKVYVGLPAQPQFTNMEDDYLLFIPFLSGYLTDDKSIKFTTNYYDHYHTLLDGEPLEPEQFVEKISHFRIYIPVTAIKLASSFDTLSFNKIEGSDIPSGLHEN